MAVSADEALHIARVLQWVPLTKCMVRGMLKNEFPDEFLSSLPEPNTDSVRDEQSPLAEVARESANEGGPS
jgi:hypothetical protein